MIRKIIVGREITDNAMSYAVGQYAVKRQYKIQSIVLRDDGSKDIFIQPVDTEEIILWKSVHQDVPCVLEYSQDFS